MSQKKISSGVVHEVPADLKKALTSDPQALTAWEDITPLARNEWICWIESAKKAETRSRRIEWGCSSLKDGERRPCCCSRQPRRAAWMAAMSIFFIVIIASKARFASPPPAASASVSARGVICQERPQRSLHQPHWLSVPPLSMIAFP